MKTLMIGHLLGDFYFQTSQLSENKRNSFKYLLLHTVIYVATIYCLLILTTGKYQAYINSMLLVGTFHLAFDYAKINWKL